MRTWRLTLADDMTISKLAHAVEMMLSTQERLATKILITVNGEYVVQAHSKNEQILRWIGMDQHLTLTLSPVKEKCCLVRIHSIRWLFQSALAATGLFVVAWPLAVTAIIGAIRKKSLARKILRLLNANASNNLRVVYRE